MATRSRAVAVGFLYWSLRRLVEFVVLRFRSERDNEIAILFKGKAELGQEERLPVCDRAAAAPDLRAAHGLGGR